MEMTDYETRLLAAMPGTRGELARATGIAQRQVYYTTNNLCKKRLAYISAFRRRTNRGGEPYPIFTAGVGVSVKCNIKPLPGALLAAQQRKRMQESGQWDRMLKKQKIDRRLAHIRQSPQPWFAALLAA